jgi:8-oxo-dGTP pyrophosphatase MutT (NUDIX family)
MPGKWSLAGGGIEKGESALNAATREAKEEAGMTIHKTTSLGDVFYEKEGRSAAFFVAKYGDWTGTPELLETDGIMENDKMVWATQEEALAYDLIPTVGEAIKRSMNLAKESTMKISESKLREIICEEIKKEAAK